VFKDPRNPGGGGYPEKRLGKNKDTWVSTVWRKKRRDGNTAREETTRGNEYYLSHAYVK